MAADECTVLVVEDDADTRLALIEVIRDLGYAVEGVANGQEALTALEKAPTPCLVLLDLMMPVMNGLELLEVMQKKSALAKIPVVVFSAYERQVPIVGATRILKKPVTLSELMPLIAEYCQPLAARS